jgi:hypothetical protein
MMVLLVEHHLDAFGSVQVMLGAPEHPLDAFIASTGRLCSETDHWMYRFSENPPRGVQIMNHRIASKTILIKNGQVLFDFSVSSSIFCNTFRNDFN